MMTKRFFLMAATLLATLAFAHGPVFNEDVKLVHEWHKQQKLEKLAETLLLDAEQIAALKQLRLNLDAVEAEHEAAAAPVRADIEALAAEVRPTLEQGGDLSEAEQAAFASYRDQLRELHRDKRRQTREAASGLEDLLTDEQRAAARELAREHMREAHEQGRLRERFREGFDGGPDGVGSGVRQRAKARFAKALLDPYFIAYAESLQSE